MKILRSHCALPFSSHRSRAALPRCLSFLLLLCLFPFGCKAPAAVNVNRPSSGVDAVAAFPRTVTDDAGRTVVISKSPQRIVSLAASNTEILYALGLGSRIVAVDQYSDYPPEAKQKPRIGGFANPDIEQIAAGTPDLIFATGIHAKSVVPNLETHGLPVLVVEPKTLEDVLGRILLIGQVTGEEAKARALAQQLRTRMDEVTARVKGAARPRVFFEISTELYTAGPGSFIDDMIAHAGGQNIAADAAKPWPQLSQESVVLKDPEVILLGNATGAETIDKVRTRPGWREIAAVKSGRIIAIDADLTHRPGPRIFGGLEAIARALHPDRFEKAPTR
jgi:iron complex transport system substrate-binding protein